MHTTWASYMSFDENERWLLKCGMFADFVLLNKNPLKIPIEHLAELKAENTYFAGEKYEHKASGPISLAANALTHKEK